MLLETTTYTDPTSAQTFTPAPFQISHKELRLTEIAVDLVKRINGTSRAPMTLTDVAMAAMVLYSSGWLRRHFDGSGHDFASPEEKDRFFTNFYDAVAALRRENPHYTPPLDFEELEQFDTGTPMENAGF